MRRLMFSLSALGFLTVLAGCHHTAGACDCEGVPHGPVIGSPAPIKPEPIKELPKEKKAPTEEQEQEEK